MIQSCVGWILDAYIENDEAILWIKTENGKVLRLTDVYEPDFYLQPKNELVGLEILKILSGIELVKELKWDSKFIEIESSVRKKLIYIRCHSITDYHLLLKVLRHDMLQQRIHQFFNIHLSLLQRYLFTKLRIRTTTKVVIEYDDRKLVSIKSLYNNDLNSPFSVMHVNICPSVEWRILDRDDPIQSISIKWKTEDVKFSDDESKILQDFSNYIISTDPDIIIFKNCDSKVLNYLLERIKILSLDLQLGRWKTDIYSVDQRHVLQKWTQGRLYLSHNDYNTNGLDGLFELAQFSFLPLTLILKYSIGRLIANRNIYELLEKDYVISDSNRRNYERLRTLEEIVDRDKAGMIFSPRVRLHENVADTDAAFVHKANAKREDYEKLGELISKETGLSISLEYHYKFLVLLPLEADDKLEALKHYFGITYDRELIMRGIETRRHDSPEFIKQFQTELLYILFDCDKSEDITYKTLENALFCVTKTIDKTMTGEINTDYLVISKQLRMEITKYRNIFPHVAAAIQQSNRSGKLPVKGDIIQYVYTNSQHQNPLNRVATAITVNYDKEKYKEMLLDAAETILGIFGFDRRLYGKDKDKKWWMELKRNRMQDIHAETSMEYSY